jgi:hypothetical protein
VPETTAEKPLVAADLLKSSHPLHNSFKAWTINRGTEPTKRQAAKFLQENPRYREAKTA